MKYWEAVYYLIDDVRRFILKQTLKSTTKQQFLLKWQVIQKVLQASSVYDHFFEP